jgi:hypothetical protein
MTDPARAVIDGWPGAAPEELFENLLAVLAAQEASETDWVADDSHDRVVLPGEGA